MPRDMSWRAEHVNGDATSTPTEITCSKGRGVRLRIQNTGDKELDISFDFGRTWYAVAAGEDFVEDIVYHRFFVKSTDGTSYTALLFQG